MPNHPPNPDVRLLDGQWYASRPWQQLRWLRDHAPCYWDETSALWGITRHEDIMAIARDPERFCSSGSSRPDAPPVPSMINMDGPAHKVRRKLVNKGFTKRRLAAQESRIRGICAELIEKVAPRGECDFVQELAAPLPMIMIGDMLGVAPEDRDRLLRWSDDLVVGSSSTAPQQKQQAAQQAFAEYAAYNHGVVADRRAKDRGDDLMSILVHAKVGENRLDDAEILHEGLLLLVGGDETTRHAISGGMEALIRHPEQRRALRERPALMTKAVEEILRWTTPIQNMSRTATRDVELRGETIRAGEKLLLLYPSGNRDERVFENPDVFDVERDASLHVAFGGYGPHLCLGANLARIEIRVMFEELLRRLPDLELASDEPLPVRPGSFILGFERMPVRWKN